MNVPTNKLQYVLNCAGYGTRDVTPLGESTFSISFNLSNNDTDARYAYDVKFSGSLTFIGDDFQWILDAGLCADMLIELNSNGCGTGFDEILTGTKIKLSQGAWDLDKCKVSIPVISPDYYECINEKKGDTLNIFDADPTPLDVALYDYVPTFEYRYMPTDGPGGGFTSATQDFKHYPNRKAEYPGFGCEGETSDPYWPESAGKLFDSDDLKELTRDALTYEEILSTGSTPMHVDYPTPTGAFDAAAVGWRLYYFSYKLYRDSSSGVMSYKARFRWVRETILVIAGAPMTAEWVYISTAGGFDKYARPPILMPRTRLYKPSYTTVAFPTVDTVYFSMTNYIVGLDSNIVNLDDDNDEINAGISNGNIYGFTKIPNARYLNDVIKYAIHNACGDINVKSEFLQINPDVATSTNYVTGATTFTDQLMIFQKTDVKRPWASAHAVIGNFTLDELQMWLWNMFKLKYCIVGDVYIIEHISSPIFRKPSATDLTTPPLNELTAGKRQYTFNVEGLVSKETFSFMEQRSQDVFYPSDDFAGVPILYDGNCVNREEKKNVLDRKVARVTTDILYVLINGGGTQSQLIDNETSNKYTVYDDNNNDKIDDDGFCIVAGKISGGIIHTWSMQPIIDTVTRFNNVLGWTNLHRCFYKHDMNAPTGTLNNIPTIFTTTKPIKQQTTLSFKLCCIVGFDPYEAITSALGDGIIKSATWKPSTQVMDVDLMFRM